MTVLSFEVFAKTSTVALDKVVVQLNALNAKLDKMAVKRINIVANVEDKGAVTKLAAIDSASAKASKSSSGLAGVLGGAAQKALLGFAVSAGIAGFGVADVALKFQDSTAKLSANANITQVQAQKIGDAFLTTAGKTTFSAAEITSSYGNVAGKLGQLQGSALNSSQALLVMNAAMAATEATGGDLNLTTGALAAVMAAFGIRVGDAGKASDILTNISRITNVSIADFAGAMDKLHAKLGPLAPDLRDTGALIADLNQHGLVGAKSILTVNTALTTLTTGSKATIAEIKRLGLQITDSKGNFVGLGSIIEQLNPKLAKMGTVQREAALKALFGAGAAGVMNDVISEGRKKFDDLSNSIGRAGSAEDQASKATDNVRDKVKIFTSGIKDLAIKIGEAILPAINNLLGMLIGILPWFDRLGHWMAENKAVIAPVAKVLGVLAAAILAVWTATKLLSGIGSIFKTVFSIGGPGLIILGIAALIVAFVILWDKSKAFRDFWIGLWNDVKVAVSDAVKVISPLLESIGKAISTGIGIVTGKKDDKGRTVTPEHVSPPAPIQPPTPSVQFSQLPSKARPILVPGYVPPTPFSLDTGPASRPVHTSGYPDVPINTDTGLVPKPKQRLPVDLTRDSGLASAPDKPKQSTGPIDLKASNIPGMWQKIWDDVLKISRNVFGELKGRFHDLTVWISKEVDAIKNWWMSIWPLMKRPLADLWNAVKIAFNIIKVVVVVALYAIWETFKAVFTILGGIVKAAVDIIEGIIKGLAEIFAGLIDFFKGIFTGNWSLMWKGIIEIVDGVWAIIWGIIKGAWDIILAIIKAAWNLVKDIFGGAGVWLVKVVINIWNDVTGWFARMWHDIVGYFIGLGRDIGNISTGIWHWLVNTAKDIWRDVTGWFVNIWHDIVGYFIGLGRDIGNIAGWIWNTVTGWARNLWRNISDTFNRMVGDLIGIFRNLANWVFRNPINFVIDWVINRGLNDLVHGVGDLFGQNWNVHVGLIPQFAQGGIVPGTDTGKDTVHAMLRPGEGVLTPEAVKRVGGATTIEKLNRGQAPSLPAAHLAAGGIAPAVKVTGAKQPAITVMNVIPQPTIIHMKGGGSAGGGGSGGAGHAAAVHVMLRPGEGILSPKAVHGIGGPHALEALNKGKSSAPGHFASGGIVGWWDDHVRSAWNAVTKIAGSAIHWIRGQAANTAQWALDHTLYPIANALMGPYNPGSKAFKDVPNQVAHKLGQGLVEWIRGAEKGQSLADPAAVPLGYGPGEAAILAGIRGTNQQIVKQVASTYGWNVGPEWNALYRIIMDESGFNNTAQNPTSSAYGIFQFLDSTWPAYGGTKTSNAALQSVYGMRYIQQRYRDPLGALAHENAFHWYTDGGMVTKPTLAMIGEGSKPELVLPLTKPARVTKLLGDAGLLPSISVNKVTPVPLPSLALARSSTATVPTSQPRQVAQSIGSTSATRNTATTEMIFSGDVDSAIANVIMKMVRDRKIQIKMSQVIADR